MTLHKKAFTLIELIISISLLSIMIIFLYKSYASLNASNKIMKKELHTVEITQKIKKVIYLDFSLAFHKSVRIQNRGNKEDMVSFQTSYSLHKRINPYVTYIVKKNKLYRLESFHEIKHYEIASDIEFDVDYIAEVYKFKIYKSKSKDDKKSYLINIVYKNLDDVLMKLKILN